MMQRIKVLVGCPTSGHKSYCLDNYASAVKKLTYSNYNVLLVDNSRDSVYYDKIREKGIKVIRAPYFETARERVVHSRNLLRDYVLKNNYDYFLSLEQDVIPPKDVIERLLRHDKKVVTGVYFVEYDLKKKGVVVGKKILPLLYKKKNEEFLDQLNPKYVEEDKLFEIAASGLGCVLIHREVLEKIPFRYGKSKLVFDDIWFCQDLEKNCFKLFVDSSVKCKHLMREMDWNNIKK